MRIELNDVSHVFHTPAAGSVYAVDRINIAVAEGRFVSIIGPSGCGKTTLFNIIAGLEQPTGGHVTVDGQDVTGMIGIVGYMLQKDLLFPWRTVLDNICLGMELRGIPMRQARERARPYLARYGLGGFEERYPSELSGGMRQRAALLRTLLYDSDVMLLDEPFGALDAQTKSLMQDWLLQLWADFRKTVLFVTHDLDGRCSCRTRSTCSRRAPGGSRRASRLTCHARASATVLPVPCSSSSKPVALICCSTMPQPQPTEAASCR